MSEAKVRLGRRLFYDTRLSGNGTFSCASCHQQGARLYRWTRACAGLDRAGASTQRHVARECCVQCVVRLGGRSHADARSADGRADVQRTSDRDGAQGKRSGDCRAHCRRSGGRRDLPGGVRGRSGAGDARQHRQGDRLVRAHDRVGEFTARPVSLPRRSYRAHAGGPARHGAVFLGPSQACARCHSGFNLSGPTAHDGSAPRVADLSQHRSL